MMRIDVDFARPLDRAAQARAILALGQLAKVERVRFVRGHQGLIVSGEALPRRLVREALEGEGLEVQAVRSSLASEPPEAEQLEGRERVRPMGR